MALRKIIIIGHETLAKTSAPVARIDDGIRVLAADMVQTLHAAPGIGLSAPQVNVPLRLIVVDLSIGENPDDLIVMVNPEIVEREGRCFHEEGCLSVPDVFEKVARPERVVVRGLDLDGRAVRFEARDLLARVFCHEIDHLDGRLFVDLLSPLKRGLIRKRFKKAASA